MNRQWLDWRPQLSIWQALEVLLLSLLVLVLARWAQPDNPLSLGPGFPWVWFAPVLLALRYGMLTGLLSAAILVGGWMLLNYPQSLSDELPKAALLGGLILTMICGEFSGLWRNRHRRQSELNRYLDQRLEELTRQHYLLKLSHDRLEQNLISRPYTLRGALAELRTLLKHAEDGATLPGAAELIALLATHCQLTSAALHPARKGQLDARPLAAIGEPGALAVDDPLVQHALDKRALAHVNLDASLDTTSSQYLVAAPLYREGELAGLLTVTHMPFFSFHQDTLSTLAALLSYYADTFTAGEVHDTLERYPDCPSDFALNLERLSRVQKDSGVASHLVLMKFPDSKLGREIRHQTFRGKRELDFFWQHDDPAPLLIALFPLTGNEGVQGYLARFNLWLETEYGSDSRGLDIHFSTQPLNPGAGVAQLESLISHAV